MSTLHDRLADLAGEAPHPSADPDLWDRGRRYGRRRRVGRGLDRLVAVAARSVAGPAEHPADA